MRGPHWGGLIGHSRHRWEMCFPQWWLLRSQPNSLRCSGRGLSAQTAWWWPLPPVLLEAGVRPGFHGSGPAEGAERVSSPGRLSWPRHDSGDRMWAPVAL